MDKNKEHIPVLLDKMLEYIKPTDGETYIDCTFGAGGYSSALLEAANCNVIALDQDPNVIETANKLKDKYKERFNFNICKFSEIENFTDNRQINGIVMDLGVSSMQIDNANRGFSFMKDGPLDMRMSCNGLSAEDFINNAEEKEIADIIYNFGGERKSRKIARAITIARNTEKITTTGRLAEIVRSVFPGKPEKIDPATRTFQAIRIYVNEELEELRNVLKSAEKILSKDGRLVVISFHSLEDSIAKKFMNEKCGKLAGVSRHVPQNLIQRDNSTFKLLTKKAIKPDDKEIDQNIRSRSARLRAMQKIAQSEAV